MTYDGKAMFRFNLGELIRHTKLSGVNDKDITEVLCEILDARRDPDFTCPYVGQREVGTALEQDKKDITSCGPTENEEPRE